MDFGFDNKATPQPRTQQMEPSQPSETHWVGPGRSQGTVTHYHAFLKEGHTFSLGSHVYLRPSEPNVPPFIACIEDLYEDSSGNKFGSFRWYYRPTEIQVEMPVAVDHNEVFASDDIAVHPLDLVSGPCKIVGPRDVEPHSSLYRSHANLFLVHRKYIPSEGRVVQLDNVDSLPEAQKPLLVEHGLVTERPKPTPQISSSRQARASKPTKSHSNDHPEPPATGRATTPISSGGGDGATRQPSSRRKRKERDSSAVEQQYKQVAGYRSPQMPPVSPVSTGAAGEEQEEVVAFPAGTLPSLTTGRHTPDLAFHPNTAAATQPASSVPRSPRRATTKTPSAEEDVTVGSPTGTPRSRAHGRWARERYDAAQRSLVNILKLLGASAPDKAVLRPVLRDEARKVVGDTGLLDHLLKHLADQIVSPEGEKLRRRHNLEGHMVYWLQTPEAAVQEEAMLVEEMQALSSELRQVKEVRHVLKAVRDEAAQAIQAVTDIKQHPEQVPAGSAAAVQGLVSHIAAAPVPAGQDLASRLASVETTVVGLARRMHDAESLAASGIQEVSGSLADSMKRINDALTTLVTSNINLERRCTELERQYAILAEHMSGQFEALALAFQQVQSLLSTAGYGGGAIDVVQTPRLQPVQMYTLTTEKPPTPPLAATTAVKQQGRVPTTEEPSSSQPVTPPSHDKAKQSTPPPSPDLGPLNPSSTLSPNLGSQLSPEQVAYYQMLARMLLPTTPRQQQRQTEIPSAADVSPPPPLGTREIKQQQQQQQTTDGGGEGNIQQQPLYVGRIVGQGTPPPFSMPLSLPVSAAIAAAPPGSTIVVSRTGVADTNTTTPEQRQQQQQQQQQQQDAPSSGRAGVKRKDQEGQDRDEYRAPVNEPEV